MESMSTQPWLISLRPKNRKTMVRLTYVVPLVLALIYGLFENLRSSGSPVSLLSCLLPGFAVAIMAARRLCGWFTVIVLAGYLGLFCILSFTGTGYGGPFWLTAAGCGLLFIAASELIGSVNPPGWDRWLVLMAVAGFGVAWLSGSRGSANGWAEFLMNRLGVGRAAADSMVFAFRKSVHFVGYGILGWSALRWCLALGRGYVWGFALMITWTLGHASFDEVRQMSLADRSGSWRDVGIDESGALALSLLTVWRRRRHGLES